MPPRPLPAPATQVDEYLYDIAMSLRQFNAVLAQLTVEVSAAAPAASGAAGPAADELVDLREPESKAARKPRYRGDTGG